MDEKLSPEEAQRMFASLGQQIMQPETQGTEYQQLNALFQGGGVAPLRSRPTGVPGVGLALGEQAISQAFAPFSNYQTAPTGTIKYTDSGVIADPANKAVFFPTHRPDVDDIEGSEEWLRKIQKNWTEDKFNKWRKQLIKLGYDTKVDGGIAEKGGLAQDVIDGLRVYHWNRYLNGGEALPLTPGGGRQNIRDAVREQVDFVSLKEEIKGWGEVPFGEALDPTTADYFADRMLQKMTELARKHPSWTMEQVQAGATTRVQKQFIKEPGVAESLEEAEDEEMSTALRDSVVSISQLGSI